MANFSIVRKGYNIEEVNSYINKVSSFTDSKFETQSKRIESLKQENKGLLIKIKELEEQSKYVSEALINATRKAKEIERASKARFAIESERIRLMKSKWISYVESASSRVYEIDESVNMQAYLTRMDDELREQIGNDLNIKKARVLNEAEEQFMSERERLSNLDGNDDEGYSDDDLSDDCLRDEVIADNNKDEYLEKVKGAYMRNIRKAIEDNEDLEVSEELSGILDESEIDIESAMNTKKSLEEICRELGLND